MKWSSTCAQHELGNCEADARHELSSSCILPTGQDLFLEILRNFKVLTFLFFNRKSGFQTVLCTHDSFL